MLPQIAVPNRKPTKILRGHISRGSARPFWPTPASLDHPSAMTPDRGCRWMGSRGCAIPAAGDLKRKPRLLGEKGGAKCQAVRLRPAKGSGPEARIGRWARRQCGGTAADRRPIVGISTAARDQRVVCSGALLDESLCGRGRHLPVVQSILWFVKRANADANAY